MEHMSLPFKKKKWTKENLEEAVKVSTSVRQVLKRLALVEAGGNYEQVKKWIKAFGLDNTHFTGKGWNKEGKNLRRVSVPLEDVLTRGKPFQSFKLKNKLFKAGLKERKCEICGWCEVSVDGRIPVELDHINGNRSDNTLQNLRILCPNCHSLQLTHRGRNKKKG